MMEHCGVEKPKKLCGNLRKVLFVPLKYITVVNIQKIRNFFVVGSGYETSE